MIRAEVVFLSGGEIQDELEEAEQSHELQEGRLENAGRAEMLKAINEMSRAEALLNGEDTARALVSERAALAALQRAFDRQRYFLRTMAERSRIDPARRLTGDATGSPPSHAGFGRDSWIGRCGPARPGPRSGGVCRERRCLAARADCEGRLRRSGIERVAANGRHAVAGSDARGTKRRDPRRHGRTRRPWSRAVRRVATGARGEHPSRVVVRRATGWEAALRLAELLRLTAVGIALLCWLRSSGHRRAGAPRRRRRGRRPLAHEMAGSRRTGPETTVGEEAERLARQLSEALAAVRIHVVPAGEAVPCDALQPCVVITEGAAVAVPDDSKRACFDRPGWQHAVAERGASPALDSARPSRGASHRPRLDGVGGLSRP